jgi:hypothetical protein
MIWERDLVFMLLRLWPPLAVFVGHVLLVRAGVLP